MRAPHRTRPNKSRPIWSVPRKCSTPGLTRELAKLILVTESQPNNKWAQSAAATMTRIMTKEPNANQRLFEIRKLTKPNRRFFGISLSASVVGDARVEDAINKVHHYVDNNHHGCKYEHGALDDIYIPGHDCINQKPPHSRPGKHGFYNNGAAQQPAEVHAENSHQRDGRVGKCMFKNNFVPRHAFRVSGTDVVFFEYIHQGGSGQPRKRSDVR